MPSDDRDDDNDDDDEVTCLRGALCCFASYAKGFGLFVCLAGWLTGRLPSPGSAYGRFVSKMYLFVCVCVSGFSFSALLKRKREKRGGGDVVTENGKNNKHKGKEGTTFQL